MGRMNLAERIRRDIKERGESSIPVLVLAADITDRDGAPLLLERLAGTFPRLQHIWADMGYRGRAVE